MNKELLLSNAFGEISKVNKAKGIDVITIDHQHTQASVSLYGGQVLTWQVNDQQPVFWLSKASLYEQGKAIRGGIPLCWPWFGAYKDGGNHGFARQIQWQLVESQITEDNVTLVLTASGSELSPLWPSAFKLTQTLIFSTYFQQQLTITNLSDQSVEYSNALHSYFRVSDPNKVHIPTLTECYFDDKMSLLSEQKDEIAHCMGPIDRIYHSNGVQQIKDKGWQRIIEIESSNCQQWVLWNPGKAIAETMADVHSGGESEYVCLEAANTQWQTIPAQQSITIGQKVTV
ncbi:MAG: D-hexose-6-phosphate mutarotase, partial [Thalassotalea sp.]